MNNKLPHTDVTHLTGFYAALIQHCETEIRQMRRAFQMELRRIKNPDAQAAYRGNHTVETCWQAYATDDFIRVVKDLLENALPPQQRTG